MTQHARGRGPEARGVGTVGSERRQHERVTKPFEGRWSGASGATECRISDISTGGCSDGNFTAPIAPTLDGLGVDGQGGHSDHEQLYVSSLEPRSELLYRLLATL